MKPVAQAAVALGFGAMATFLVMHGHGCWAFGSCCVVVLVLLG